MPEPYVMKTKTDYFSYHNKYFEQSTFTHLTNSLNRFENQFEEKGYQGMSCLYRRQSAI